MAQVPEYTHDLGNGQTLTAYSLSPEIGQERLVEIVQSADGKGKPDFKSMQSRISHVCDVPSLRDLVIDPQNGEYHVPEPLQAYRHAIETDWNLKGRHNGPVIMPAGKIEFPLKVFQGWYYDFAATKLTSRPGELLPEVYDSNKTVEDILLENRFGIEDKAAYFALAHLINTSQGKEFVFVQRAKNMGIADDCIAIPGSTPDLVLNKPGLKKQGFGIEYWWSHHMAKEMREEYNLGWGDFWTGTIPVFDDKRTLPAGVINVFTELSTKQLAETAYGIPRVLKEHTVFYGMKREAIPAFLQKFPVFEPVAFIMNDLFS